MATMTETVDTAVATAVATATPATHDIHLLVDRSGSMDKIITPTVSGLNEFVGSQKHLPNAATTFITLHTFDDKYETPIPRTPLAQFPTITAVDIGPRGMTALYDAVGTMFTEIPMMTPTTVVIVTDGEENASKEFKNRHIMDQITERRRLGWTFIFLAANQDAIASGVSIGIPRATACTFNTTPDEVRAAFRGASNVMARACTDNTPPEFTQLERETSANNAEDTEPLMPPALSRSYSTVPSRGMTGYPCQRRPWVPDTDTEVTQNHGFQSS